MTRLDQIVKLASIRPADQDGPEGRVWRVAHVGEVSMYRWVVTDQILLERSKGLDHSAVMLDNDLTAAEWLGSWLADLEAEGDLRVRCLPVTAWRLVEP